MKNAAVDPDEPIGGDPIDAVIDFARSGWNPPVDRNETRICRECNQTFKPTHVMQRSHAACEWHD